LRYFNKIIFNPYTYFLSLFTLNGCISVPTQEAQDLTKGVCLSSTATQALQSVDFEKGDWIDDHWWDLFGDPQLSELVLTALRDNPTLKRAQSKIEYAKEIAKQRRARLFPELSFEFEDDWQHLSTDGFFRAFAPTIPPVVNVVDVTFNFNYELDFFGKNRFLFRSALGVAKANEAESAQAVLIISTAVVEAYLKLQTNLEKLKVLKEIKQDRASFLHLNALRFKRGIESEIVPLGSEQDVLSIQNTILQLEEQVDLDLHLIKALLNLSPDDPLEITSPHSFFDAPFPLPDDLSIDLLARRPDLMAQIWMVESAAQQIGAAKTEFYPNVNLRGLIGLESVFFRTLFSKKGEMGFLDPAIHLPIFTAGRLKANLAAKVAEFKEASHRYREILMQAAKEVADGLTKFQALGEQIQVQGQAVDKALESHALTYDRYIYGVNNYLKVLQSEELVWNQRLMMIELQSTRLLATLHLIKALGGGYHASFPKNTHSNDQVVECNQTIAEGS
jgi:NodT family efflux transporter outer membrane factor (OMF) lipoprotein